MLKTAQGDVIGTPGPSRLLRFHDLKARGIVNNWATLRNWIAKYDFPVGRKIGPNTRAWDEDSVERWLADRPSARRQGAS